MSVNQWIFPKLNSPLLHSIVKEFRVHPVIAQILISRGFSEMQSIHEFLYGKLPNLFDPNLFVGMDIAVHRIFQAIEKKQRILLYGDNDVDGMTGVALLTEFLRLIGADISFHLPNRSSLKKSPIGDALAIALEKNCALLITIDCGTTAAKEIAEVTSHGIDVIITDHHEPNETIPNCTAILNPKLKNSPYPNRDLTGVGVAFKLAHALTTALIQRGLYTPSQIDLKSYLDLVCLGTVADMGALRGENRILVRYGLKHLENTQRIGLSKLFAVSELEKRGLSPTEIASKIAPRLNSLGRIADPTKGVELLLIKDSQAAEKLALELNLNNLKRQELEREAVLEIEDYFLQHPEILNEKSIILQSDRWHPGIIAILSSRIAKQTNRPTLILSIEEGIGKGSLRTTPKFPLLPMLKENQDLLITFGGHNFAAGLTIKEENIGEFTRRFRCATEKALKTCDLLFQLQLDAKASFDQLTFEFMESFNLLQPFGVENAPPLLFAESVQLRPPKRLGKEHLKLFLQEGERQLEGIAFGLAQRRAELNHKQLPLRIAFTPEINTFQNKDSIQLQIKDFQIP